jgi:hypothetical protein
MTGSLTGCQVAGGVNGLGAVRSLSFLMPDVDGTGQNTYDSRVSGRKYSTRSYDMKGFPIAVALFGTLLMTGCASILFQVACKMMKHENFLYILYLFPG